MTGRFSRRKRIGFAALAVVLSVLATVGALAVVDELLRRHYAGSLGLNRWGYRGQPVGPKQPGERRAVVLGGSTAFGYGVPPSESVAAQLERRLRQRRYAPVSVVNLAFVKEGAWSFRLTLADYAYLGYDVAILYEGYNDLRRPNVRAFRRESPVFRLTGYFPFLPLVLVEKARAIQYRGDLQERFGHEDPAFHPGLADRAASKALKLGAEVARSLEGVLGPLTRDHGARERPVASGELCREPFRHYCQSIESGVEEALRHGARVAVVTQPYISDVHIEQQRHLAALIGTRYGHDRRVVHLDLGWAVDLRDRELAYDGMHLTRAGNDAIAARLVEAIDRLLD